MKMVLLTGSFIMLLSSCEKDWTCECNTTDSGGTLMYTSVGKIHDTRNNARQKCSSSSSGGGNSWTTTCKLK